MWYSPLLVPGEHFIPASAGFARIGEEVRAAMRDDAAMRRVGENAAAFADVEFSDTCIRAFTAAAVRQMHRHVHDPSLVRPNGRPVEPYVCPAECQLYQIREPDIGPGSGWSFKPAVVRPA